MACLKICLYLFILVKGSLCSTTEMTDAVDNNTMSTVVTSPTNMETVAMNETKEMTSESTTEDDMITTMSMKSATNTPTTVSTTEPTTMSTTIMSTITMPTTTMSTTTMSTTAMKPASTTPCSVCTETPKEQSQFGSSGLIAFAITLAIALILLIALIALIVRRRMKSQRYDAYQKGQSERRMDGVPLSMPMNNTFSGDFGPNVTTIDLEDENNQKAENKVGNGAGLSSFGGGKSAEASAEDIDNLPKPSWLTVEPSENLKESTESLNSEGKMMPSDSGTNKPDSQEQDQTPDSTVEEPILIPPPDTDSEQDTAN